MEYHFLVEVNFAGSYATPIGLQLCFGDITLSDKRARKILRDYSPHRLLFKMAASVANKPLLF